MNKKVVLTQSEQPIRQVLLQACQTYVQQRIDTARQAMEAAQASANEESKSSAGDKYETGRAMAQIERDRHAQLLAEALKLQQELSRINVDKVYETAQPGSLVSTDRGRFFISISAGKLTQAGADYFAVSPASPIAALLMGKRAGEVVTFNRQPYRLLTVE